MTSADPADHEKRLLRLERRLEREKSARNEAEQIAEAGLRSLYDANQELDQRILERTAELNEALAKAQNADRAKSAFLGQMSHQINTPLNGLLGMLELLASELPDEQGQQWHSSAMRSARRLERLTTRLITYVELEDADLRGQGPVREVGDFLNEVHGRWQARCLRAAQLMAVEVLPGTAKQLHCCAELDVLFDELLMNVVEHTGPGSVTLSAGSGSADDSIEIQLHDPGLGLAPQYVRNAQDFGPSANQTTQADHQVQLGLAIVDRIVRALGGSWRAVVDPTAMIVVRLPSA